MSRLHMSGSIYAVTPVTAPLSLITPYSYHVLSFPIPLKKTRAPHHGEPQR